MLFWSAVIVGFQLLLWDKFPKIVQSLLIIFVFVFLVGSLLALMKATGWIFVEALWDVLVLSVKLVGSIFQMLWYGFTG